MRPLKFAALGTCLIVSGAAMAADAPSNNAAQPIAPAASTETWTGCHVGLNAGAGFKADQVDYSEYGDGSYNQTWDEGTSKASDFVGGVDLGCDKQLGSFVFGLQGRFDYADMSGSSSYSDVDINNPSDIPFAGTQSSHTKWYGTATGRAGYLIAPATLAYLRGGLAYVEAEYKDTGDPGYDYIYKGGDKRYGWTVGGGFEQQLSDHISFSLEYNYLDFGRRTVGMVEVTDPDALSELHIKSSLQTVNFGISYRF